MRLLVCEPHKYSEEFLSSIKNFNIEVSYHQNEMEKVDNANSFDFVICNGLFVYNNIDEFTNLKYIQLSSAGFDRVPMDKCKERNIRVYNARNVYDIPISEWVIMALLNLYKRSYDFYENQKEHKWIKLHNLQELNNKKALIIGCGNIGNEIAKKLSAFNVELYGVDLFEKEDPLYRKIFSFKSYQDILSKVDIVVISCPLTDGTYHMVDKSFLNNLKKEAIFINASRGKIVNQNDLIMALKNQSIAGAALDVFEEEPLNEFSPLWSMNNVIIWPHNSYSSVDNQKRLETLILNTLGGIL